MRSEDLVSCRGESPRRKSPPVPLSAGGQVASSCGVTSPEISSRHTYLDFTGLPLGGGRGAACFSLGMAPRDEMKSIEVNVFKCKSDSIHVPAGNEFQKANSGGKHRIRLRNNGQAECHGVLALCARREHRNSNIFAVLFIKLIPGRSHIEGLLEIRKG